MFTHKAKQLMHLKFEISGHAKCQNEKGELKQTRCERFFSQKLLASHFFITHPRPTRLGKFCYFLAIVDFRKYNYSPECCLKIIAWFVEWYSQIAEVWATMVTWTVLGTVGRWTFFWAKSMNILNACGYSGVLDDIGVRIIFRKRIKISPLDTVLFRLVRCN